MMAMVTTPNHSRSHLRRRCKDDDGQAMVEMVPVVLILLALVFGVIDFGRAIMTRQIMVNVSREGANLASRGTSLSNALAAVVNSARPLDINENGYVILTSVSRDSSGKATIGDQQSVGGQPIASRIGTGIGTTPVLPNDQIPTTNQTLIAAEVFYQFVPITPVGKLLGIGLAKPLYDAAYF